MANVQDAPQMTVAELAAEIAAEASRVRNGFVEVKVYVTNNVMENFDITTHRRNKGKVLLHATN